MYIIYGKPVLKKEYWTHGLVEVVECIGRIVGPWFGVAGIDDTIGEETVRTADSHVQDQVELKDEQRIVPREHPLKMNYHQIVDWDDWK